MVPWPPSRIVTLSANPLATLRYPATYADSRTLVPLRKRLPPERTSASQIRPSLTLSVPETIIFFAVSPEERLAEEKTVQLL